MQVNKVILPNGQYISLPQAYEENDAKEIALKYAVENGIYNPNPEIEEPEESEQDILPSLERGTRQVGSMLATTGSEIADVIGFESLADTLDEFAAEQQEAIPERRIKDYKEGLSSIGSFIDYAQQAIAETAPSMAVVGSTALAGAGAGSVVPGPGTAVGAVLGAFLGSMGLTFGEIRQEVERINPDAEVSPIEIAGAAGVGALDAFSAGVIFKPILGRYISNFGKDAVINELVRTGVQKSVATEMVKAAGRGILSEAPTEALQEAIEAGTVAEATDTNIDLNTLGNNMIEAALMGGIAGGFFGGASSGISTIVPEKNETDNVKEITRKIEDLKILPQEVPENIGENGTPLTVSDIAEESPELTPVISEEIPLISTKEKIAKNTVNNIKNDLRRINVSEKEIEALLPIFDKVEKTLLNKDIGVDPTLNPEIEPIFTAEEEGINITSPKDVMLELSAREEKEKENFTGIPIDPLLKDRKVKYEKFNRVFPRPPSIPDIEANLDSQLENLINEKAPLPIRVKDILERMREGPIDLSVVKEKLDDDTVTNTEIVDAVDQAVREEERQKDSKTGEPVPPKVTKDDNGQAIRTVNSPEKIYSKDNRGIPETALPSVLKDHLKILPVPKSKISNPEVFGKINDKINKITGGKAELNLAENLQDVYKRPVRGVQVSNILYVASDLSNVEMEETALHEAFHFLRNTPGVFNQSDLKLLEKEAPRIRDILSDEYSLDVRDLENLGPLGQEELQAELFGKFFANPKIRNKVGPLKSVYNKAIKILKSIKNALNGAGFRTFEDLFNDIAEGRKSPKEIISDAVAANQSTRFQEIRNEMRDIHPNLQELHAVYAHPIIEDLSQDGLNQSFTPVQRFLKSLMSAPQIATFSEIHANVVNHFKERREDMAALMTRFENNLRPYFHSPNFEVLNNVIDHLAFTEQSLNVDDKGRLTYTDENGVEGVKLPKDISDEIIGLQAVLKDVPRVLTQTIRDKVSSEFPELANASGDKFLRQAEILREGLEAAIEESEKNLINEKANFLENAGNQIKEADSIINSNASYFPHMRFGEYGIVIENNEKGGKKFFAAIDRGYLSKWNETQLNEIKDRIKNDPELSKQYNYRNIKPFKLTYNSLIKRLDQRMITPELVGSLLGSGSKEYKKIAEILRKEVGLSELEKHFKRKENLPGYSKDYERVLSSYLTSSARHITNIKYSEGTAKLDTQISKVQDTVVENDVRKYFDYVNDPNQDMVALRTFNFMYTMGGNVSTALLQFVTLPTTSVSLMMQWNPNFITNNGVMAKSFYDASKIVGKELSRSKGKLDTADTFSRESISKLNLGDKGEENILFLAGRREILNPNLTNESLGGDAVQTTARKRQFGRRVDKIERVLALPIASAEQTSRISSLLAFYRSLNSPSKVQRALRTYENDKRFQNAYRRNENAGKSKVDDRTFVALYALDEAHGIFGKEGRGVAQRGLMGSLVFPFMTHPIQMMELLVRQMSQRGAEGKGAAAYVLMSYITLAGLMGIPGMELIKELIEFIMELSTGVQTDILNDITLALHDMGFDPMVGQFVRGGATRAFGNIDVARRINVPIFFQNPLIALMEGDVELRDIAGVAGQLFQTATEAKQTIAQGDYGTVGKSILPVALRNLLKGAYDLNPYLGEGISTRTGKRLINPEEASTLDRFNQTIGITPSIVASRREALYEHNIQAYGYRTGEERFRSRITNLMVELNKLNDRSSEQAEEIRDAIRKERKGLIAFRKRNGLPIDTRYWAGFNRGVQARVRQRLHPEKIEPARRHIRGKDIEQAF